jgi:hypothetical protein
MNSNNKLKKVAVSARRTAGAAESVIYKNMPADGCINIFSDRQSGIIWNHKTGEQAVNVPLNYCRQCSRAFVAKADIQTFCLSCLVALASIALIHGMGGTQHDQA